MKKRPGNLILGIQMQVIISFYIISVLAIYAVLFYLFYDIVHISFGLGVILSILYFAVSVIFGAFLSVLMNISSGIAYKFDPIKNDIANRKIDTSQKYAEKVSEFLCKYFNYAFFDVKHSLFKVQDENVVFSDDVVKTSLDEEILTMLNQKSSESEEVNYIGKYSIGGSSNFLYLIPVWFGEQWYGYMAVMTNHKLLPIFIQFLYDFEDNYVDDQLVHTINYQKTG